MDHWEKKKTEIFHNDLWIPRMYHADVIAKIFVYERAVIYCADGQKQSVMFFLFLEIQHVAQWETVWDEQRNVSSAIVFFHNTSNR